RGGGELPRRHRGSARRGAAPGLDGAGALLLAPGARAAAPATRSLRLDRVMARALGGVVLAAALLALPLGLESYQVHIVILVFLYAYVGTAWNVLGGFCGQLSFGHALYLGLGAYTSTLLLLRLGLNPWLGLVAGAVGAAVVGTAVAWLSFHYR